jgi:hypothetical protein
MIVPRFARLAPLLLPLLFISATCITGIRGHGATGPWVGEITNYGSETMASVYVNGRIEDAAGRTLTYAQANACPSQLAPGERATFEVFPKMSTHPRDNRLRYHHWSSCPIPASRAIRWIRRRPVIRTTDSPAKD